MFVCLLLTQGLADYLIRGRSKTIIFSVILPGCSSEIGTLALESGNLYSIHTSTTKKLWVFRPVSPRLWPRFPKHVPNGLFPTSFSSPFNYPLLGEAFLTTLSRIAPQLTSLFNSTLLYFFFIEFTTNFQLPYFFISLFVVSLPSTPCPANRIEVLLRQRFFFVTVSFSLLYPYLQSTLPNTQ